MSPRVIRWLIASLLLAGSVLGLVVFLASLFAVEMIQSENNPRPGITSTIFVHVAGDIDARLHLLPRDYDTILAYAVPGIWLGILTAFFLALIYSIVRAELAERPH